jgi:hypothetical protein
MWFSDPKFKPKGMGITYKIKYSDVVRQSFTLEGLTSLHFSPINYLFEYPMATMHPIEAASDDERDDIPQSLPPMRPCSSATTQSNNKFSHLVSFVNNKSKAKNRTSNGDYLEDANDDSSVETMTSASLYSLRNYRPKKEPSFADYIFCQASFRDIMEEFKGTWEDATSAVDQVVHAFVISDEDIDRITEQIELAEKDIDTHVVQVVRGIGVLRC